MFLHRTGSKSKLEGQYSKNNPDEENKESEKGTRILVIADKRDPEKAKFGFYARHSEFESFAEKRVEPLLIDVIRKTLGVEEQALPIEVKESPSTQATSEAKKSGSVSNATPAQARIEIRRNEPESVGLNLTIELVNHASKLKISCVLRELVTGITESVLHTPEITYEMDKSLTEKFMAELGKAVTHNIVVTEEPLRLRHRPGS